MLSQGLWEESLSGPLLALKSMLLVPRGLGVASNPCQGVVGRTLVPSCSYHWKCIQGVLPDHLPPALVHSSQDNCSLPSAFQYTTINNDVNNDDNTAIQ